MAALNRNDRAALGALFTVIVPMLFLVWCIITLSGPSSMTASVAPTIQNVAVSEDVG